MSDEDALEVARCALRGIEPADVKKLPRERRDEALRSLRAAGITVKELERLMGVGHNTISRVTKRVNLQR